MIFSKLIQLGAQAHTFSVANRVRMTNIVGLITIGISLSYTLIYIFILYHPLVAFINALFTIAYSGTLFLNKFHANREAKIWFFTVLMLHLYVCTNLYVTNVSGFHLYYFLVPTGAYLLFELNENIEKLTLSVCSVVLFFYCENTLNLAPLITISDDVSHAIYQSVIFFIMVEVIVVLTLFTRQIEKNEAKLTKQATTDALTGIANRHQFFELGNKLVSQADANNRPLSVILLDFDHFKNINDKYGHFAGDICLTQISHFIQSNCRVHDLFARIGGEEFVLILPETTSKEAGNYAEKLRANIADINIIINDKTEVTCTVSIGISTKSNAKTELKNLLVQADKALYQAKNHGRNRVFELPE